MADTTFIDYDTSIPIVAAWLNDVNKLRYGASDSTRGAALLQYMASATASVRTAQAKMAQMLSVVDFGADPTGATSSSTAIAAAIAALPDGGVLLFEPGTYKITATIEVFKKLYLIGATMSEGPGFAAPVTIKKAASLNNIGVYFAQNGAGSVMEGFVVDAEGGSGGVGIQVIVHSVTLRNVSVFNQASHGIRLGYDLMGGNANDWELENVVCTDNGGSGVYINDKYASTLTGAVSNGSKNFVASGAFFTSGVTTNYIITIVGAGAGGTDLVTTVDAFVSATQVTLHDAASTTVAAAAFWVSPDVNAGVGDHITCNTNAVDGILLDNGWANTFLGPHAEQNVNIGFHLTRRPIENTIIGGDLAEGNNAADFSIDTSNPGSNMLVNTPYTTGGDNAGTNTLLLPGKGTFTPTIAFGGASVGVTYGTQYGEWSRLGNRIVGTLTIILTAKGASTGNVSIGGLPYTAKNIASNATAPVGFASDFSGLTGALSAYVAANTKTINLMQSAAAGTVAVTDAAVTNTTNIQLSFNYPVAD